MPDAPTILVRGPTGDVTRIPFDAERAIVGRAADAQVRLDHGMVSRHHAEIARDASGRLHIRDLGSRNGTLIDGQPVTEHTLRGPEQIGIGPFLLSVLLGERDAGGDPASLHTSTTRIVIADNIAGKISILREMAAPRVDAALLTNLTDFSRQLLDTPDAVERARALCRLMVGPQFRGHWGVIVRVPPLNGDGGGEGDTPAGDRPPQLLHEAHGALSTREPYLSRSVLRTVRETGEAALAANVGLPAHAEVNVEVSISPNVMAMAAVACPVARTDTAIDVLYVMLPPSFGSGEWLALVNLAVRQYQHAEAAWAARRQAEAIAVMERELARAKQIQLRLVPKRPTFDGLDLAIGFVPCRAVGGDYVDALPMADGRTLLAIADVCGKGLPAALVASSLHTMVHASVLANLSLADLMTNLNAYLCQTLPDESFVTMIAVAIDARTGAVEFVNAGHPPALLLCGGSAQPLDEPQNLPLGIDPSPLAVRTARIACGHWLALYTDGLTELRAHEERFLGIDGLATELCALVDADDGSASDSPAESVATFLANRLDVLQGQRPPDDDRTFLLVRRTAALPAPTKPSHPLEEAPR
jgi:serine phosphatase RsbU (regulator of sigma subunit)